MNMSSLPFLNSTTPQRHFHSFVIITETQHKMMYKLWSEQDDYKLWSLRSKPTYQLAEIFNKTTGAIQSRLKHLNDPKHKAHQRLFKNGYIMATDEHCVMETQLDKA